ncbi:MAG TPA: glycine cleavage T C-terminal barrel domain-containing protein [Tepidisphaeraceae bacterium]|jgi:glycine cleavage system aminomethyltransferase T|nr:glycine cleavage T C-terminal barrel domain-containing protein [Tepidisphaeraceae bacterium]
MAEPTLFPNPLLPLHQRADAETQAYDALEIVTTFGHPGREYGAIHEGCGLMDLPQRGVLELTGVDRLSFLNNLVSNVTWDTSSKKPMPAGSGVYAFFLNLRGRIVADMNILDDGERTLVETDIRKVELLRSTWDKYLFVEKVKMTSQVGHLHSIALHGPKSEEVLRHATGSRFRLESPLAVSRVSLFGIAVTIFRDDACGVPGYQLLVPIEHAPALWTTLIERLGFTDTGKHLLRPIGWAAYNAARIEAGRPLLDIDMPSAAPDRPGAKLNPADAETAAEPANPGAGILPAETGQAARALNYSKCYVGQEIVARMHARNAMAKQLVGIRMPSDALPIAGSPVLDAADNAVGAVTSSTVSPLLGGVAICMAYVKKPHFALGTKLRLPAEGEMREGEVVGMPFVVRGEEGTDPKSQAPMPNK